MSGIELWGGHECTVNRIKNRFFDQTVRSGHHERPEDLGLFASLGVRALRYPVLWERIAPDAPDRLNFAWSDERLARIRDLGIRPILGLLHHGSGPRYTSLIDPNFAAGFAAYAGAVAKRYPWITDWTPVNEPLTTARFSGLYGHWYPHARDDKAFLTCLFNQLDGTRAAIRAIREIIPNAKLIQTEDLGHVTATRELAAQSEFENARRWLSWDLLFGQVGRHHPMWDYLERHGFAAKSESFTDDPCAPDVLGVNYYITSERFLDHRQGRYPRHAYGGNGRQRYADVEAVRILKEGILGPDRMIEQVWERYRAPIAITEAHLACTREDQARWFLEIWNSAHSLAARGVAIRAVTAWSLLGSYDWNSLLRRSDEYYESGVFDVRATPPRPTVMVPLLQELSAGKAPSHPVAHQPGWWRRDIRLTYESAPADVLSHADRREPLMEPRTCDTRPVLIVGASGTLGQALARACARRGLDFILTGRAELALEDSRSIEKALDRHRPWAVINAAGWVQVDDAEIDPDGCLRANRDGAIALAKACAIRDLQFVTFSSDLVFDGSARRVYVESDAVKPLNVYGRSKAEAERAILDRGHRALVIRTSAFFSPWGKANFAAAVAGSLWMRRIFEAPDDLMISPTYVPDLVEWTLDLLIDGMTGLCHLSNNGVETWHSFAQKLAAGLQLEPRFLTPCSWRSLGWAAERPPQSVLASERGPVLPSLDDAISRFAAAVKHRYPEIKRVSEREPARADQRAAGRNSRSATILTASEML